MWPSGVTNLMVPASPVSVRLDRMHGATTFGHQKQLVVKTVPVHGRPRFPCRDLKQHSGNPILGQRTIFIDANRHRPDMERLGLFFLVQLHRNRTSDRHCCDLLIWQRALQFRGLEKDWTGTGKRYVLLFVVDNPAYLPSEVDAEMWDKAMDRIPSSPSSPPQRPPNFKAGSGRLFFLLFPHTGTSPHKIPITLLDFAEDLPMATSPAKEATDPSPPQLQWQHLCRRPPDRWSLELTRQQRLHLRPFLGADFIGFVRPRTNCRLDATRNHQLTVSRWQL